MKALGIIFANIYDSSVGQLTNKRTMASLPFGGRYRQIDFTLSNLTNAGIRQIGIISWHNYQSLMAHIGSGEEWDLELQEAGLEFLTPFALGKNSSYRGKLDALNSIREYLSFGDPEDYVVLADSSVLYNINISKVLESHVNSGKDITVLCKEGVCNGEKQLDLALKRGEHGNITDMIVDQPAPAGYLASMGLFVIRRDLLLHHVAVAMERKKYRFERDFMLAQFEENALTVNVYCHDGVVLYNESTEEYYRSNLAVMNKEIRHDLFGGNHPIYTKVRDRVPSYYGEDSCVEHCVVADGCFLEGTAKNSVLFRQVTIAAGAVVEDCVIMNDSKVGENCRLKCVILDKDVVVEPGTCLEGTPENPVIIERGKTVCK